MSIWIDPRRIAAALMDDVAVSEEAIPSIYRMLGEFTRHLSMMPEYYQHSAEKEIKNSTFEFPMGMTAVYSIHLCHRNGTGVEEAIYGSHNASNPFLPVEGCTNCTYWKDIPGLPVVQMDMVQERFYMPYGDAKFDKAIILYQGPMLNEEGVPMIPAPAEFAAKAYCEWRLIKRKHEEQGPGRVPHTSVDRARQEFERFLGDAKAEIKMPTRPQVIQWMRNNHGARYTSTHARRKR